MNVRGKVEIIDKNYYNLNIYIITNKTGSKSKYNLQIKVCIKLGQYFEEVVSLFLASCRTAIAHSVTLVIYLIITGKLLKIFKIKYPIVIRQ